ncbi:MAG: hypothetical protein DI589_23015 [Shinella sp.]|nr:MAG: hypothetical protein DI589_23015 [Shinella sp.]
MDDTPAAAIARLDAALQRRGQALVLRRYTASSGNPRPNTEAPVRGFVRPVEALAIKEFVGNLATSYFEVVISPTDAAALLPIVRGDKIVIDGKERNVETFGNLTMNDVLVRINLTVAG